MRAIVLDEFGGVDKLVLKDIDLPEIDERSVRIKVYSIGLNFVDSYLREGNYYLYTPSLPLVLGFDCAGLVDQVGEKVDHVEVGDRVFVSSALSESRTGSYAEYVVVDRDSVHHLPDSLSFDQGAAIGFPASAAFRALFQRSKLKPGDTVLIHGASGSVGVLAIQMAKAVGAKVLATAGSEAGLRLIRDLGADYVFNHRVEGYVEDLSYISNMFGIDIIIEMLASENLNHDLRLIAKNGDIIILGTSNVESLKIDPKLIIAKEANILGMALWDLEEMEFREIIYAVAALVNKGVLKPYIGGIYPLEEVQKAHMDMEEKRALGKRILRICDE